MAGDQTQCAPDLSWLDFYHRLDGHINRDLFAGICPDEHIAQAKRYMLAKGYKFYPVREEDWDQRIWNGERE